MSLTSLFASSGPMCSTESKCASKCSFSYSLTANSLFFPLCLPRYKTEGPADLTVCYMTVFISEVLRLLATKKTRLEGEKKITELSMKANFAIPGESKFPLAGFFGQPASRNDAEQFRQYFRPLREETCMRSLWSWLDFVPYDCFN